jgi:hypothetical protein
VRFYYLEAVAENALKAKWFASLFLLLAAPLRSAPTTCDLPTGLYQRRHALYEQFLQENGPHYKGNDQKVHDLLKWIHEVDAIYFNFLNAVSQLGSSSRAEAQKCCARAAADPLAVEICALTQYLSDRASGRAQFVEPFSKKDPDLEAFFAVDDVAEVHKNETPASAPYGSWLPRLFGVRAPVEIYIDELYKLVSQGDLAATRKYFTVFIHSDGCLAEDMSNQVYLLLENHPNLMIRNWQIIRGPVSTRLGFELISPEETTRIRKSVERACRTKSSSCKEILALFP